MGAFPPVRVEREVGVVAAGSVMSLADLAAMIEVIPCAILVKNSDHRILMANDAMCALIGHSRAQVVGHFDSDFVPADEVDGFLRADRRVLESGEPEEVEEVLTRGDGSRRTVVTRKARVILDGAPHVLTTITDVTAYREAVAHNRYLALHDHLTGLANRALLNERIEQALARESRTGRDYLLFIDLDRFKAVNDANGHQVGDALLARFAERLTSIVRASDTVARLGGDEFALFVRGLHGRSDVERLCTRILDAAGRPFHVEGVSAFVSASVGVVGVPRTPVSRIELKRRADVALYQAKREGRACYRFFSPELDAETRRRRAIEADLRVALAHGEGLAVHYQPQLASTDHALIGVEALVRWQHPRLGALPPAEFIPIAEETGQIDLLGEWVLRHACAAMARWGDLQLAVNLSPVQLRNPLLVERILAVLAETGFPARRLQLEVTESALLADDGGVPEVLERLRGHGVRIVLDDFGTGYSSLSHLQRLDIDKVKIDKSFIQALADPESAAIVHAVTSLAAALHIPVTAEGVETEDQRRALDAFGALELQGYLMAPPMAEAALRDYVARHHGLTAAA